MSQISNLVASGALGDIVLDDHEAQAYLATFWSSGTTESTSLMACIQPSWLRKYWRELVPTGWICWIGRVVVCRTGPHPTRDWAIFCLMVGRLNRCAKLTLQSHDGRIKYDPQLEEDLLLLSTIVQAIAAVAEEIVSERAASNPPPEDDPKQWLLDTLACIKTELASRQLDRDLELARDVVASKQAWLGSKRNKPAYEKARATAEAAGKLAEVRVWSKKHPMTNFVQFELFMTKRGQKARATDLVRHVFAAGAPGSEARQEQWAAQVQSYDDQLARGLLVTGTSWPRPASLEGDAIRDWWLTRKAGTNMTYAAQRADQANPAAFTSESARAMFDTHRAKWLEVNCAPDRWTSIVELFDAIKQLATTNEKVEPKRRLRVLHCILCDEWAITTHNGKHRCGSNGKVTFRDLPSQGKAQGVLTKHLVYPRDLIDHPVVGRDAWKLAEVEKLLGETIGAEGEGGVDEEALILVRGQVDNLWNAKLAACGLVYLDGSLVCDMLELCRDEYPWIDSGLADRFPSLPLYLEDGPDQSNSIMTQLVDLFIEARYRSQAPGAVLSSSLDTRLDDVDIWQSATLAGLLNALAGTSAIHVRTCNEKEPCDYWSLGSYRNQHAHGDSRPRTRLSPQTATSFEQLPLEWQRRVWCRIRNEVTDDSQGVALRWQVYQ